LRPPRPKTLFLPVLGLLAAVLVLLTVVTITTYFNLDRAGRQAERVLAAQGSAIVSGLAAGLRTGWRHWIWQADSLQEMTQQMSHAGDVAFIALLDGRGRILAHSNPNLVGKFLGEIAEIVVRLETAQVTGWFDESGLYLSGRRLGPEEYGLRPPGEGPGPGMMMRRQHLLQMNPDLRPQVILVGLETKTYREARGRQLQHALIMAGLLFVLGSGAIYFIFVLQNYRTIDRTLSDLTTYTSQIVDNMPNGLITLDARGEPVMINRTARRMYGWGDREERSLAEAPAIKALWERYAERLKKEPTVLEEEFESPMEGGGLLPLAVGAASVPGGALGETEPGLVFILRDLRQIRALEDRVRQNEKLAAVGRLAAGVAHEVRNPLSSMRGLARFLARDLDEKSREAEYLKVMVEEIDRLDRVISGLLDFARPRQPELKPVNLNETARHTVDLITDDARHQGISVREDLAPEKPVILADRDQAVQAMLNVLLNAIEAMPQGGRMTVSTRSDGRETVFMVEDSGPGFPPGDRGRFLDPFFTTKEKGSGLGLAQVARIMEAHGGSVELGGEPGMGARVALRFPTADKDQSAPADKPEEA